MYCRYFCTPVEIVVTLPGFSCKQSRAHTSTEVVCLCRCLRDMSLSCYRRSPPQPPFISFSFSSLVIVSPHPIQSFSHFYTSYTHTHTHLCRCLSHLCLLSLTPLYTLSALSLPFPPPPCCALSSPQTNPCTRARAHTHKHVRLSVSTSLLRYYSPSLSVTPLSPPSPAPRGAKLSAASVSFSGDTAVSALRLEAHARKAGHGTHILTQVRQQAATCESRCVFADWHISSKAIK